MLLQRSKLAAATVERPRLSPPWSITLLGVLVLAVLFAIYPHKALVHRIIEAPQSELTDAYLVNLLRTDSGNPHLHLTLARHEMSSGLYDKLELTLTKLLQSPDKEIRLEATWLSWRAAEQRYFRMDPGTPQRAAQRAQLRSTLRTLAAQEWPEDRKIEIARLALQFNDTQLGIELLQRVAASGQGRSADWYAEAARAAMAGSEYLAAGKFYLIAVRRTSEPIEQRRFFIDGMLALQSGDQVKEALALAEEELAVTPSLGESAQVLELLVRFARSVRRPDLADKYARKLLRLSLLRQWKQQQLASAYGIRWQAVGERSGPQLPFDDRIYTLGFEAFLDNRKLEDAWQVAASAVRQAPDHLVWRERLARVSEWSGRPAIALTHWLYLARANGSDEAWQAILRLSPGLFDDNALLIALEHQLRQQPANPALAVELVATFERLGDPRGAMRVLEQLYRQRKQPELLAVMAELAGRMGEDKTALELWQSFMTADSLTAAMCLHRPAAGLKSDAGLYKAIRSIYNPAGRLADFYATHLLGGQLAFNADGGASDGGAFPIITDNEALRLALGQVMRDSNWQVVKQVLALRGTVLGDGALMVRDEVDRVYVRNIHPSTIADVEVDSRGYVRAYKLEETRTDPEDRTKTRTVRYTETAERDGDAVV